ncbi:family 43 glycosylhydrolase [Nonomuraea sp. NPDC049129]|uniref:family 43 glycosylhydrolase n=1 Tax=Nonomuraea sp. NPDC049129 TaxID=3155272 RepID=UPI0033F14F16
MARFLVSLVTMLVTAVIAYAASTFGSRNSAIFLATSATGASGTWANQGLVISTTSASSYNAIDPNLVTDAAGNWWLSFGSFWTGIKLIPLNSSTGLRSGSALYSIAQRTGASTAVEAPFIFRHGSYYYLWHQAVITDSDADVLFYHYYADNGASLLGINLIAYDGAGWPYVY